MKKFSTWLKEQSKYCKSYYRQQIILNAYLRKEDLDGLVKEYIEKTTKPKEAKE